VDREGFRTGYLLVANDALSQTELLAHSVATYVRNFSRVEEKISNSRDSDFVCGAHGREADGLKDRPTGGRNDAKRAAGHQSQRLKGFVNACEVYGGRVRNVALGTNLSAVF